MTYDMGIYFSLVNHKFRYPENKAHTETPVKLRIEPKTYLISLHGWNIKLHVVKINSAVTMFRNQRSLWSFLYELYINCSHVLQIYVCKILLIWLKCDTHTLLYGTRTDDLYVYGVVWQNSISNAVISPFSRENLCHHTEILPVLEGFDFFYF